MASLYKRIDSPYFWIKYTNREKQLLGLRSNGISTRKKSKRKAEYILKEKQEILLTAKFEDATENSKDILFSDVLYKYIEMNQSEGTPLSDKTINIYNKALNKFWTCTENKLVEEYNREDYRNFINFMDSEKLSQNTKAMYTGRIVALFNWLKREQFINAHYFKSVKEEKIEITFITSKQMKELLNYANGTKFYHIVKFMALSAFRAHEALKLNKNDIKKTKIFVLGKGNKKAHIPILTPMKEFLSSLPEPNDEGYYFPNIEYIGLRKFFQRASNKLKFKVKSHDMRRYRLSRMANNGVNLYHVMEYARHSKLEQTQKYLKVDFEDMVSNIEENMKENDLD